MKNKTFRNVDFPSLIDAGYNVQQYLHYWALYQYKDQLETYFDTQQAAWIAAQEHSGLPFIPDYHGAVKAGYYVETHPTRNVWLVSQFASMLYPEYAEGHIQKWFEANDRLQLPRP